MRPLQDVRILALEQYASGPFGSMHLGDLGADVIKIEDPKTQGDVGRYVPPFQVGEDSLFFEAFNRNKRSLSLDITTAAGREVFLKLVSVSDVVYSNVRGDVPDKLGIRYEDLAPVNPAIVCASISGFGANGPRQSEPGYDYILQGLAGWMELTGEPDGPPTKSGLSVVDFATGLAAGVAILAALHQARRDGVGCDCDISLFDTAYSMLTYPATWYLNGDFSNTRTRHSAHPSLVPFQAFEARDRWMIVGCAKEKFWPPLCEVVGRTDLITDSRFVDFPARRVHAQELLSILEEIFVTRDVQYWLEELGARGVPCGPVNTPAEALADPQVAARNMVVTTSHPVFGEVKQMASAVRVGSDQPTYRRAPRRNEDADDIFGELLGYSPSQVEEFAARGAFGELASG